MFKWAIENFNCGGVGLAAIFSFVFMMKKGGDGDMKKKNNTQTVYWYNFILMKSSRGGS